MDGRVGPNFKMGVQGSTDRQFGPNFKEGMQGPEDGLKGNAGILGPPIWSEF